MPSSEKFNMKLILVKKNCKGEQCCKDAACASKVSSLYDHRHTDT